MIEICGDFNTHHPAWLESQNPDVHDTHILILSSHSPSYRQCPHSHTSTTPKHSILIYPFALPLSLRTSWQTVQNLPLFWSFRHHYNSQSPTTQIHIPQVLITNYTGPTGLTSLVTWKPVALPSH